MITPNNLVRHELIGLTASANGARGKIVDETKNTIIIKNSEGKEKKMIKKDNTFQITLPDGTVVQVKGEVLQGRPEERIKKKHKEKNRWLEA